MTTSELREQIDAFILKFEGQEAEEDTLNCLVWLFEKESKRIALEARKKDLEELFDVGVYKSWELEATVIEKLKDVKSQLQELDK